MSADSSEAKASATAIIVRDNEELGSIEVLMIERSEALDFAPGATTFPGGAVDPGDFEDGLTSRCQPFERLERSELGRRVAVIREVFEETGLLFAFDSEGWSVREERRRELAEKYRDRLISGEISFGEFAETEGLIFAPDDLHHFAHWITPKESPKRFDTHFYIVAAPDSQHAEKDGGEAVSLAWVTPTAVLKKQELGEVRLMLPTEMNLRLLADVPNLYQALKMAKERPILPVTPEPFSREGKNWFRIPSAAGYGVSEIPCADMP